MVAGIAEHTDDLDFGWHASALAKLSTDRMHFAKVVAHECLVDETQFLRTAPVAPLEVAAYLDWYAERFEITRRDGVEETPRHVAILRFHNGNRDLTVPPATGQQT